MSAPLALLTLLLSAAPDGEARATLALAEVLESIEDHHALLRAARLDATAAEAEALAASGAFDPLIKAKGHSALFGEYTWGRLETAVEQPTPFWGANLFAGWRVGAGYVPPYYGNYDTNALGELRAGVEVPLWRDREIDKGRGELAKARLSEEAAALGVLQQALDLQRAAAHQYWNWVVAGERLRVAESLLRLAKERDRALTRRVKAGDLAAFEAQDNERAMLQREGQKIAAAQLLQQAAVALSIFLRDEEGRPRVPSPSLLPASLPSISAPEQASELELDEALARRPDVARLELTRQARALDLRLAENAALPLIDVSAAAAKDLGPGPEDRARPELQLGLLLEVPTLNRAAKGRARAAEAAMSKASALADFQRDRAAVELRDAHVALENAWQRARLAAEELRLARALEQAEVKRFTLGDSNLLFVNLREQAAAEAAVRMADAVGEYEKARASLRVAAGLPLRSSSEAK